MALADAAALARLPDSVLLQVSDLLPKVPRLKVHHPKGHGLKGKKGVVASDLPPDSVLLPRASALPASAAPKVVVAKRDGEEAVKVAVDLVAEVVAVDSVVRVGPGMGA